MRPAVNILSHGFAAEYEVGWVNGLAANGVDVTLVGSDTTLLQRLVPGVNCVNLRGSQDPRRSRFSKLLNMARYLLTYLRLVWRQRHRPTHVIGLFSTRFSIVSLVEAWLTRLIAGRFILTAHNLLPHDRHTWLNSLIWGLIYRAPGLLVVHSPKLAIELTRKFGVPARRILYIGHGVDRLIPRDSTSGAAMRLRFKIPAAARVILFFGAIAPYKGLDLLCEAFALTEGRGGSILLIAGRCKDPAYRETVRRMVELHPLRARIHWWDGFVPDDDVPALLNAADVLVLPYRRIDQSGVLFMALSNGLPVVATDVGVFREMLTPAIGKVVPTNDATALADALLAAEPVRYEPQRLAAQLLWRETLRPMVSAYGARMPDEEAGKA